MLEFTLRRKIARIIKQLSDTLHISPVRAVALFYCTETCHMMHDPKYQIHYMSDTYLVNNIIHELRERQG